VRNWEQSLAPLLEARLKALAMEPASSRKVEEEASLTQWLRCLAEASSRASERILASGNLVRQSAELAENGLQLFLFDPARELSPSASTFAENRLDASFYICLASEASFVQLCRDLPQDQVFAGAWFSTGPPARRVGAATWCCLLSGSMFEYLMPLLVHAEL